MMSYRKTDLQEILLQIDLEASLVLGQPAEKLPVVIVGGSAFLLSDLTNRPTTHDIDVLNFHRSLTSIFSNYHLINNSAAAYIDALPYNFEDRLIALDMQTSVITYLVPSLEDLIVMKLYAWRPNDIEDITSSATLSKVDWDKLDMLVYDPNEAQAAALVPRRYAEMVAIYEDYRRRYHGGAHV
jgi:hypothetical protein